MLLSTHRPLPAEIRQAQVRMEQLARDYGLDFFDTIFEMVDYEEMSMLAAFGGFPIRYPHWRFGAQFDELMKGYSYGLQKIYEMVINTDPCYAYLLDNNMMVDQRLVIAHVYGHCDFFKNNAWFAPTNRKMLDQMANHAARVNRYIDRHGFEQVEMFIDACLSLEDLIDPFAPHRARTQADRDTSPAADTLETSIAPGRLRSNRDYMDSFINPPDVLQRAAEERQQAIQKKLESRSFPEEPQRDVLGFLLLHAPLTEWQHDILSIIRDEAYYFVPQAQTKIMNEGWASYWHSTIMTRHGATPQDFICYADHHSGTMATSTNRLNPYKLGIELFRDIEDRWNKGRFGTEYDNCDDYEAKRNWDLNTGAGRDKIFEVRRVHNDLTFIDAFLTPEFCLQHRMFSFEYNSAAEYYEIASREFPKVKEQLLRALTNHGRPFIYVVDGNHRNRGELYLKHDFHGSELRQDYARDTLEHLCQLWSRPVHIESMFDDGPKVLSYDGKTHSVADA